MRDHVACFWQILETENVRILVDARRVVGHDAPDGPSVYFDSSSFSNDVAKALVTERKAGWQPIETAPKTGRVILFARLPLQEIEIARWLGAPHNVWVSDNGSYECHPTHWMPLPAPPSAEPSDPKSDP